MEVLLPTATVTIYNNDVPTVRIATTTTPTSDADPNNPPVCGDLITITATVSPINFG